MDGRRSRRETSVIARIRPAEPCGMGPYTIVMIITEALQEYRDILSIGFSSTNFVIGLNSPENQLAILYTRLIEGPRFILDIVPWCPEYVNFDLPWITKRTKRVLPPGQSKIYMDNLISHGKPLQQYVSRLIKGQYCVASALDSNENSQIHIPNLNGMGKAICMPDFSYLMILELKSFYNAKFIGFRKCAQSCQELCDCAYELSKDLQPLLQSIVQHTQSISKVSTEEMQFLIQNFGGDVQSEALYIAEELIGIGNNIYLLYNNMTPVIDLTSFKKRPQLPTDTLPANYTMRLKIVLSAVVQKIHRTAATVTSERTATGNFITYIFGPNFSDSYKSLPMISQCQAETDAIYQFLRRKTNVLGYSIVDLNYPTLANLVSEINKFNEEINEFLVCATKAATMIRQVHKDIRQMYQDFVQQVDNTKIQELKIMVQNLLSTTETYSMAADHGFNTFKQNKEAYEAITLQTKYRSKPTY